MGLRATYEPSRPDNAKAAAERCFSDRFRETCRRQGHRTALVDGEIRLSFSAWEQRSESLAAALAGRGVKKGDTVAFQLPNWWETAVVFTAIARLGAVANPLLPILRERELHFMLSQSGARHLFVPGVYRDADHRALAAEARRLGAPVENVFPVRAGGDDTFVEMIDCGRRPPAVEHRPEDLLLLMYTSGTTAAPKGVLHTNRTLTAEVDSLAQIHDLSVDDRTLMPSPLTHISGVLHGIMSPAMLATSAVLMNRWDARLGSELIANEKVTYMVGAPIFLQDLLVLPNEGGWSESLRLFSCGGAQVSPKLMRDARAKLDCAAKRVYGSTEFPTISTTHAEDTDTNAIETEGRPIGANEVRIVAPSGDPVARGREGEIQARGPECFVGYADATMNVDSFTSDGWFRTGDLGKVDGDGYLTVTGRIKEIVIRKGEKISIREVEEVLLSHPAIREVCLVGISDPELGERLCAAIVLEADASLSTFEVGEFLTAQGLTRRKLPERILFTESLPRTESGKTRRAAVTSLFDREATERRS